MKVFLGGTCNESKWRDMLIPLLDEIDYFNPVVDDWTEEAYQNELVERRNCDVVLYCITPEMTGVYSIAEVVDDSNKRPGKTIFCWTDEFSTEKFDEGQQKSLDKVGVMVKANGGVYTTSIEEVVRELKKRNSQMEREEDTTNESANDMYDFESIFGDWTL